MDWFDDDSFWSEFEQVLFSPSRLEAAEDECEAILDLVHLAPGAAVLDLACGIGRHALAFARRGFAVTGVDRTSTYLKRCAEGAAAESLQVELVHSDMRSFCRPKAFSLALSLYTSFGFFPEAEANAAVLTGIYRSLEPGGCAVFDLTSKEIIARDWRARDWRSVGDGAYLLEQRTLEAGFSQMRCEWTLLREGRAASYYAFRHWLYSAGELATLLRAAGFCRIQLYGDLQASPYDQEAERLVAVAWR